MPVQIFGVALPVCTSILGTMRRSCLELEKRLSWQSLRSPAGKARETRRPHFSAMFTVK